jgi:hypothetical protein
MTVRTQAPEEAAAMHHLTVPQRWGVVALCAVVAAVALIEFIYWFGIVENHPWFKHSLLFGVLTVVGLCGAAWAWPHGRTRGSEG